MNMKPSRWSVLVELLKNAKQSVAFAEGLSDSEVERAEERYEFQFPPDLREFLQTAMPKGSPFPNWRSEQQSEIRDMLRLPIHGVLFDVERNDFWLPEWGPKPIQIADAKMVAEELMGKAPRLIPVYGPRMIPDRPCLAGTPVFSVHQTDLVYWGFDLDDYFRHEFGVPELKPWPTEIRRIEFWDVDRWQSLRWR